MGLEFALAGEGTGTAGARRRGDGIHERRAGVSLREGPGLRKSGGWSTAVSMSATGGRAVHCMVDCARNLPDFASMEGS